MTNSNFSYYYKGFFYVIHGTVIPSFMYFLITNINLVTEYYNSHALIVKTVTQICEICFNDIANEGR